MNAVIKQNALPLTGGAGVENKTPNYTAGPCSQYGAILAIRAALVSVTARELVRSLGPDLFGFHAERVLVTMIVLDRWDAPPDLTPCERAELDQLTDAVDRCTCPDGDDRWAVHLITLQAERRFGPLLAAQLAWAMHALHTGMPLRWVLAKVNESASIALGLAPFDPSDGWGEAA